MSPRRPHTPPTGTEPATNGTSRFAFTDLIGMAVIVLTTLAVHAVVGSETPWFAVLLLIALGLLVYVERHLPSLPRRNLLVLAQHPPRR